MSIERLMELVPPPQRIQRLPINWDRIESTLGIALPVDYKQLAELYGPGVFADSIVLYAPTSKEEFDLLTQTRRESEFFRSMIEGEDDKGRYYPLYPDRGGILSWGYTTGACKLFWLTNGSSDGWPIVVASEFPDVDFYEYAYTTTDFIVDILTHTLDCDLIAPPEPGTSIRFNSLA
ncbi:MAG TPA: SMI1/KNR4 family protein [Chloroflexota bacterium]|nr:SMI1/KNR4 family protein [Chloroflexota bacterium]